MKRAPCGRPVRRPQAVLLLDERHDGAALRRLVGKARQQGGFRRFALRDAGHRDDLGRHAVAEGDGAGLVEQQRVHVACRLDRPAGHGEHVEADEAIHAGDADGRKQAADGRRDQRDEQRHQHRDRDVGSGVAAEPGQRHHGDQEHDGHARQQDVEGDLVRRLLPLGAFDEGDHAVEERGARRGRDPHDQPVGDHRGAAGDGGAVAAGLADDGADSPVMAASLTEAMPSTTSPSPGIRSPASTSTRSPMSRSSAEHAGVQSLRSGSYSRLATVCGARLAQGVGLRPAAPFGHGLGEVGEQHREPEPGRDLCREERGCARSRDRGRTERSPEGPPPRSRR